MINAILNNNHLDKISGGEEYISEEYASRNALNYYINLLPSVSREHYRIRYEIDEWTQENCNENSYKRNLTQTMEISDMKWSVLSSAEKRRVIFPAIGVGFIAGCVGIRSVVRLVSNK